MGVVPAVPKPNQLLRFVHVKAGARNAKSPRWEVFRKVLLFNLRLSQGTVLATAPHVFPSTLRSFFPCLWLAGIGGWKRLLGEGEGGGVGEEKRSGRKGGGEKKRKEKASSFRQNCGLKAQQRKTLDAG